MPPSPVAVIDIGSNSIKSLVARRGVDGGIVTLAFRTLDARIGAGIASANPRLSEEGMAHGLDAIRTLLAEAETHSPARTVLVATSAVRDAQNGADFRARIHTATGHDLRILSGGEEANLIGRGLTTDPALRHLEDFYVFDLGGGSLECLAFRQRRIEQAVSLPLGCVRLTERFVSDPAQPLSATAAENIAAHVRETFAAAGSGFSFSLPPAAVAVGTGGTVATVRAIFGAREGKPLEATPPTVGLALIRELFAWMGALPLAERKQIAGLPPARADVFPAALATLSAVAGLGRLSAFENSLCNLRHGLAAELLSAGARPPSAA